MVVQVRPRDSGHATDHTPTFLSATAQELLDQIKIEEELGIEFVPAETPIPPPPVPEPTRASATPGVSLLGIGIVMSITGLNLAIIYPAGDAWLPGVGPVLHGHGLPL